MRLKVLKLHNFQGIKDLALNADGGNLNVFGDNGVGKTTIFSSITWLLFDKDSSNRKDFEIKTLDANGQPHHGLDHEVEATFENGKAITLRRVYKEKWAKKRGQAQADFTGHTTDYFINDVPVKKTEFTAKVAEMCDEGVFKLLTNPSYLNEQVHWQERRRILLEVCGDISDVAVIASDKALAKLPEVLGDHSLDDYKKIIAARRTKINDELKLVPARIDEVHRGLPDITGLTRGAVVATIAEKRGTAQTIRDQISRIESGGEIAEKKRQLALVEAELQGIKNDYRERYGELIQARQDELSKARDNSVSATITTTERTIRDNATEITRLNNKRDELRTRWFQYNDLQFQYNEASVCPTCNQAFPESQLAEAREKALGDFNTQKANKLEEISAEGRMLKARVEDLEAANAEASERLAGLKTELETQGRAVDSLLTELETLRRQAGEYTTDPLYAAKVMAQNDLLQAITNLQSGSSVEITRLRGQIADLEAEISAEETRLGWFELRKSGEARIKELEAREKELAAEYERLESELYLCEQFIRSKVALLEEKINAKFELARFKLFREQINGGLEDCCETTFNGVPYSGGLNNGARINVGLDIIRTLSDHYGFHPVVFVDNAEAVTQLLPMKAQMIRLVVSERDKVLRVERETNLIKEAM